MLEYLWGYAGTMDAIVETLSSGASDHRRDRGKHRQTHCQTYIWAYGRINVTGLTVIQYREITMMIFY